MQPRSWGEVCGTGSYPGLRGVLRLGKGSGRFGWDPNLDAWFDELQHREYIRDGFLDFAVVLLSLCMLRNRLTPLCTALT